MARQGTPFNIPKRSPLLRTVSAIMKGRFEAQKLRAGIGKKADEFKLEELRQRGRKELAKFTKGLEEDAAIAEFTREETGREADIASTLASTTKTETETTQIGKEFSLKTKMANLEQTNAEALVRLRSRLSRDEIDHVNSLTLRRDKVKADLGRLDARYKNQLLSEREREMFELNRPKWQAEIDKIENDIELSIKGSELEEAMFEAQQIAKADELNWDKQKTALTLNAKFASLVFGADEALAFEQTKQAMEFYYTSLGSEGAESVLYRQVALEGLRGYNSNMEAIIAAAKEGDNETIQLLVDLMAKKESSIAEVHKTANVPYQKVQPQWRPTSWLRRSIGGKKGDLTLEAGNQKIVDAGKKLVAEYDNIELPWSANDKKQLEGALGLSAGEVNKLEILFSAPEEAPAKNAPEKPTAPKRRVDINKEIKKVLDAVKPQIQKLGLPDLAGGETETKPRKLLTSKQAKKVVQSNLPTGLLKPAAKKPAQAKVINIPAPTGGMPVPIVQRIISDLQSLDVTVIPEESRRQMLEDGYTEEQIRYIERAIR